ncbi:MAG: hypothetical protein ABI895_43215 [Deltaproteobacteria bacterium]
MSFDTPTLLAGLFVSSIGFVLLRYGKKMSRPPQLMVGLVLMVYPYFVPGAILNLVIGAALLTLLWVAVKQGY